MCHEGAANHFHLTSDIRVIRSPEYMAWRWTDLSFSSRRGSTRGMDGLSSEQMLRRLDQDGDGKLSKTEMPERMQERWQFMDINRDGFVDQEELAGIGEQFGQSSGDSRRRPAETRPDAKEN